MPLLQNVTYSVLCLAILLVTSGNHDKSDVTQPENTPPQTPEWVLSMPVSMNGRVDESLPPFWTKKLWHDKFRAKAQRGLVRANWKADNFFDDPAVIKLCNAIFAKDVPEMERLIADGADINTIGENGMTPLYWAFYVAEDPRPFECLIQHEANPNILTNLNQRTEIQLVTPGSAVVHLVASGRYNRQFKNVFENGGDPNLRWKIDHLEKSTTPYLMTSPDTPDSVERLRLLIRKGARVNDRYENGMTHASAFAARGEELRCRLVLVDLEGGADYKLYYSTDTLASIGSAYDFGCYFRLIHFLAEAEPSVNKRPKENQTHYRAVVKWLEEHGESFADAKADLKRWDQWKKDGETGRIKAEHQKRLLEEADRSSLFTP